MKGFVQYLLLLTMFVSLGFAQQEPIPPRRAKAPKFGFFGGFTPGWLFVDVKPINEFLVPANGAPLKDNGVIMYGGGGSAYIMFIPNLRIGGLGISGSLKSTSVDGSGVRRDAELSVGFGGVTIEYVVRVVERLDVAVGVMLGGGGIGLTLREDVGGNKTWDQEWSDFGTGMYGNPIRNISRDLSGSYFVWVPSVSVEYPIVGWLAARLGFSYVGMSSPSWKLDDEYDLIGVPGDVNGEGFMINAGLFVGVFQ